MRYRITTPVADHKGEVGRLMVHNGAVEVDGHTHRAEVNYMRGAGYGLEPLDDEAAAEEQRFADAARVATEQEAAREAGAPPEDQAAQIAALQAQLAELKALVSAVSSTEQRDVDGDGVVETLPRRNASVETWRAFAVEHGVPADEANTATRDELIARLTKEDNK